MGEEKLPTGTVSEESVAEKKTVDKKSDKKGSKKKRNLGKYFRDLKGEFNKIIWPTFPSVVRNTLVTLAMCAFVAIVVCLVDFGLNALIDLTIAL